MDKGKNVNNIKCHQEKALLWRMWATALSFVIPAISLGTSMAYSVVGKDFYMRHRNLDGSDALATESKETTPDPSFIDVTNEDGVDDPFTRDQISWFVSVLYLTFMIGTLLSGSVIEKIGCLWTLRFGMVAEPRIP